MRTKLSMLLVVMTTAGAPAVVSAQVIPGAVPANLEVLDGRQPFLTIGAEGTQNYVCLVSQSGFSWSFFGPQATLVLEDGTQVATHYLSANPVDGAARPTWQHSTDSSRVWAAPIATSTDAAFVAPGAIPWLLLKVVGAQPGPNGSGIFTGTAYIQRVLTEAGTAPSTGCKSANDVGKKVLVPYTTQYVFYR